MIRNSREAVFFNAKKNYKVAQMQRKEVKMEKIKVTVIAIWSAIMGWLGVLATPVMALVVSNAIDYFSGCIAAKFRGQQISSYKSIEGIAKKICMWLLVAVGYMIDVILMYASSTIGIELPFKYLVACFVSVWLVCNEIISILENIADIGVKLPPFMQPAIMRLKSLVESKAAIEDKTNIINKNNESEEN